MWGSCCAFDQREQDLISKRRHVEKEDAEQSASEINAQKSFDHGLWAHM
jgi:hypothetical protein